MTRSSSTTPSGEPFTGILGGTFDPVHLGHLAAARQLLAHADLAEVWLLPNNEPPHRPAQPRAAAADRLRMAELAAAGEHRLQACDLEVRRGGVSYTVDTLRALVQQFPARRFVWLLGTDAARGIRRWHEVATLLGLGSFVIFNRPPIELAAADVTGLGFPPDRTRAVQIESPPISAREIRERLAQGLSIDHLVPEAVARYIRTYRLYQPPN